MSAPTTLMLRACAVCGDVAQDDPGHLHATADGQYALGTLDVEYRRLDPDDVIVRAQDVRELLTECQYAPDPAPALVTARGNVTVALLEWMNR